MGFLIATLPTNSSSTTAKVTNAVPQSKPFIANSSGGIGLLAGWAAQTFGPATALMAIAGVVLLIAFLVAGFVGASS